MMVQIVFRTRAAVFHLLHHQPEVQRGLVVLVIVVRQKPILIAGLRVEPTKVTAQIVLQTHVAAAAIRLSHHQAEVQRELVA